MDISFLSLRVGTKFGVVSHTIRLESKNDFDYWTQNFNQTVQQAVLTVKEISFRKWKIVFSQQILTRLVSDFSLSMEQTFV